MKNIMKGISFLLLILIIKPVTGQNVDPYKPDFSTPQQITGYTLHWQDEFNVEGKPDPVNWGYETGFVRNKELQWYQPNNANCSGGVLVIEGRRQNVKNPHYQKGSRDWRRSRKFAHYTSSAIETKGKRQFHFGRIIVRARMDTSLGAWPAIWTLGIKGNWPRNGEVDIMEFYRWHDEPIILANACWGDGIWSTTRHPLSTFLSADPDWAKKFHIWRMDWSKDSIKLYLDDQLMNGISLKKTINPDGSNPFLQPQYLLLNLAIGSSGGDPSNTQFPIKYEVDYVRYYKKNS